MADKYLNPQLARRLHAIPPEVPSKDASDIVTYVRKQVVKKTGDGEDDFVIEEKIVEDSRVNRQAYIAKDAADVGVMNILEKVRRSGDFSLLDQTGATFEDSGEVDSLGRPLGKVQDYSHVPSNAGEAMKAIQSGAISFSAMKEIFGDISFEDLANMSTADLSSYLQKYIDSKVPQTESKEGENK